MVTAAIGSATEERFALRRIELTHGALEWREAGAGTPLVLLHGIGSGSASWAGQLEALAGTYRVIAWDAPGYGGSSPLATPTPLAIDHARVLGELLQRLNVHEPVLLGHSLGAIVACAWAAQPHAKLRALLLASPARGYGNAPQATREAKYRERVELIERLGVEGLAAQRSARLCAPGAPDTVLEQVRRNMARVTPGGYAQAAHILAHDDLMTHLRRVQSQAQASEAESFYVLLPLPLAGEGRAEGRRTEHGGQPPALTPALSQREREQNRETPRLSGPNPRAVLCGELDSVTPPAACELLAREAGAAFVALPGVGHACYVEDPAQFNAALRACLSPQEQLHQGTQQDIRHG